MGDRNGRPGAGRRASVSNGVAAALLAALLGGCVTDTDGRAGGATIAFESIDGPPRPIFDRLVARLDAVARARQVAVVSREMPARYRVRAYLAAKIEPRRIAIAWVWDVYDSELRRALRIAGEEEVGRRRLDAWAAVDDRVLDRIAEAGMARLAAFAAAPEPAPAEDQPAAPEAVPPVPGDPSPDAPAGQIRVAVAEPTVAAPGGGSR